MDPPSWANELIHTLESCTGMSGNQWIESGIAQGTYAFGGIGSPGAQGSRPTRTNKENSFPPASWGTTDSDSMYPTHNRSRTWDQRDTSSFETRFESDYNKPESRRAGRSELQSAAQSSNEFDDAEDDPVNPFDPPQYTVSSKKLKRPAHVKSLSTPHAWAASSKYNDFYPSYTLSQTRRSGIEDDVDSLSLEREIPPKQELTSTSLPRDGVGRAIALYDFAAVEVVLATNDCLFNG